MARPTHGSEASIGPTYAVTLLHSVLSSGLTTIRDISTRIFLQRCESRFGYACSAHFRFDPSRSHRRMVHRRIRLGTHYFVTRSTGKKFSMYGKRSLSQALRTGVPELLATSTQPGLSTPSLRLTARRPGNGAGRCSVKCVWWAEGGPCQCNFLLNHDRTLRQ